MCKNFRDCKMLFIFTLRNKLKQRNMKNLILIFATVFTSLTVFSQTTLTKENDVSEDMPINDINTSLVKNIIITRGFKEIIFKNVIIIDEQEEFVMFTENGVGRIERPPFKIVQCD